MANFGRRRGDVVGYQRGSGNVEVELANLQSEVERIGPIVFDLSLRTDDLESSRDSARGMLKVIAALQTVMILSFIALLGWGLNHVTFHSDWERPSNHSSVESPQDSGLPPKDYYPEVTK